METKAHSAAFTVALVDREIVPARSSEAFAFIPVISLCSPAAAPSPPVCSSQWVLVGEQWEWSLLE